MELIKEMQAGKLKVKAYDSRQSMGVAAAKEAAAAITQVLSSRSECNIIFAAAPSQNEFLAALIEDQSIEWSKINGFHMDEYIGLDPEAPQGFGNFLKNRIFSKVPFKTVNYINGNEINYEAECARYSELLKQNPPDIVFMGIGENGHIAFNDPHVALFNDDKMIKVVDLDEKCRNQQVNDGCFKSIDQVPTHAFTLTIPTLVSSKYIFCMVPAKAKAEAVFNTIKGEIKESCPASILRTHDNAVLYIDQDSGSMVL